MSKLEDILDLLGAADEDTRRELLVDYASRVLTPAPGQRFQASHIRTDPQCSDEVGVHINVIDDTIQLRISLGPRVQTLTRAFAAILTHGLDGEPVDAALRLNEQSFDPIVGALSPKRRASLGYLVSRIHEVIRNHTLSCAHS